MRAGASSARSTRKSGLPVEADVRPIRLHTYFRSSAAYRVRIALELKELSWEPVFWNLVKGEHLARGYQDTASFGLVPLLEIDGLKIQQSMAIIEYLDARFEQAALFPSDEAGRARARSLASLVACEVHPLNNLRVLKYLRQSLSATELQVQSWYRHWCEEGLAALERELCTLPRNSYAIGETPSIVDCFIVPQVFNARRFKVDMAPFARVREIVDACMELPAFRRAEPGAQADSA